MTAKCVSSVIMSLTSNYLKRRILDKIKQLKSSAYGDLTLNLEHNRNNYQLILLTKVNLQNKEIIRLLAKWRKMHEKWFPAQFKVTEEGTKKWLKEKVIDTTDRLLFMIKADGKYIGHIGLFRFDFDNMTYEIDNIVRGEPLHPGIMTDAISKMMYWGKKELGIKIYKLQTFSHNARAFNIYSKLGFREIKRTPLMQIKKKGRIEWVEAPKNYNKKIKRFNVFMRYKKISFAGPSITEKEVEYVVDGVTKRFYKKF